MVLKSEKNDFFSSIFTKEISAKLNELESESDTLAQNGLENQFPFSITTSALCIVKQSYIFGYMQACCVLLEEELHLQTIKHTYIRSCCTIFLSCCQRFVLYLNNLFTLWRALSNQTVPYQALTKIKKRATTKIEKVKVIQLLASSHPQQVVFPSPRPN